MHPPLRHVRQPDVVSPVAPPSGARALSGRRLLLGLVVGTVTGVAAGFSSAGFLHALTWATENRLAHPWLLGLLPIAGLGIGGLRRVAGRATAGTNLILEGFHDAEPADAMVPGRLAPYVFVGSVITHLFGGSGGREGAAVQIAAGLTAPVRPPLERFAARSGIAATETRRLLMVASLAGGFGSVFGVPLAGTIFGVEVARHWQMSRSHLRVRISEVVGFLPTAMVASFVGNSLTLRLGIHHHKPPRIHSPLLFGVIVVAIASGLLARAYLAAHHLVVSALRRSRAPQVVWPVIGGALVVAGTVLIGTRAYLGLSVPLVDAALAGVGVASAAFVFKLVFTAVTLGSGFPGGEVTPLLCMGACLGATLAHPLGESASILAAVGMVATWAAASNTPVSAAVMGAELFGPLGLLAFAPANVIATAVSGNGGVYHGQK